MEEGEIIVSQNDFGFLVETFIYDCLRRNNDEKWLDAHIREWWPKIESYYRRKIICAIEVDIHMDETARDYSKSNRRPLENKEMWKKIVKDLRDPRSPFTTTYQCDSCKKDGIKLWRDYQTFADYVKLTCAACLAPDVQVGEDGMWQEPGEHGMRTDQLKGKVPAVPVGDSYWGYSSVPSQDLEWWLALPTYTSK